MTDQPAPAVTKAHASSGILMPLALLFAILGLVAGLLGPNGRNDTSFLIAVGIWADTVFMYSACSVLASVADGVAAIERRLP